MFVYLDQIGCRLNYSESATLAGQLQAAGHVVVAQPEEAQVIVFNSCAVTAAAGRKSRQRVYQLARTNPAARIVATGCWATLQPQQAAQMPGVAMVVDNAEKELLHTLLEPWSAEFPDPVLLQRAQPDGTPFTPLAEQATAAQRAALARTRAFIKVQDGCNNKCTFCIVTKARGDSRSRSLADIVAEVRNLAQEGVQEAVLTGVHLGSYGRDLAGGEQCDLKQLTRAILADTDIRRLRLSSLEPWELADGFFDLWQQWPERLCPHLHLPLQAGTDKQLRRMARRCTTASFAQLVDDARAAIPDLVVTTDLIVGFPGETARDFEAGLAYVEALRFAHAHIFPFSPRAGTAAAGFADRVSKADKKARSQRMHQVVAATGRQERQRFLTGTRPVLWEGTGVELTDQAGALWTGFTDNYLSVQATAPLGVDLHNQVTNVQLTELNGDTFFAVIDPVHLSFNEMRVMNL